MGCAQSKTNEQEVVDPTTDNVADFTVAEVVLPVATTDTPAQVVEHEVAKEEPAVEVKTPDFALQFVPGEVSINEYGIAFYNFDGSNPADPSLEVHVCKRYSDFRSMHGEVSKLMASEKNVKAEDRDKFQTYPALPSMPPANAITYVLGRGNPKVVKEREAQFVKILNAIAKHPIAARSKPFTEFMT
ncbi:Phox homologous domain [Phytophthora cinnamomi]|uniref:Phox homologous domain n=1 Tax=Phytophthora cinnamomi TaxID=4785 RepID=UPI003559D958|nr:Phox homologous domain [Phytophthora cinnamomi]